MAYRRNNKNHRGWDDDSRNKRKTLKVNTQGNKPCHVTVVPHPGEHPEKAVKRFLKKCKKLKIVEECRKREYYEKPSVKRRRRKIRRLMNLKKLKND